MVGKVWSDLEERYFWRTAVSQSSKRAGIDRANGEKTWDQLASEMHRAMERQGDVRRVYTSTMLFEHYFQNIEGERRSPNATAYVNEYLAKLGPNREVVNARTKRPRRGVARANKSKASRTPLPAPVTSATHLPQEPQEPQDENVLPSVESSAHEKTRPIPRSVTRAHSHRFGRSSSRGSSRPSRPLRPLAPANKQTTPSSRLAGPSYSYTDHQTVSTGWNTAPSMPFVFNSSSIQYQTPVASRPTYGGSTGDFVWGYQMGKRAAPELPAFTPRKAQKTSVGGVAGRNPYPEFTGPYGMAERSIAQLQHVSPTIVPQAVPTGRTSSDYSTDSPQIPQQEFAPGYQGGQHRRPESLSNYSAYTTTYASSLTQTASNDSADESLFVEDGGNEGGVDEVAEEAQVVEDVRAGHYRHMSRGGIINWDDGNASYDNAKGGYYIPEVGGSY
ncbi:hypothetical protein F5Y05DRAFT_418863 [Hypoxylon sp. FL0543]|nr:hypothetical protein F5Y05DRAFT_418863 [Hypoxylon sp. FL0543]